MLVWVAAALLGPSPGPQLPPPPEPPADEYVAFARRGLILRTSAGITHCAQDVCDSIPLGGLGRFDVGYRLGLFTLMATVSGGGGRLDIPDFENANGPVTNARGGLTFLFAGAVGLIHPISYGRFDPWLGVGFGYSRVRQRIDADQTELETTFSRGGVELGTGLDIYVARRVALGPRFDATLPFGGSICTNTDGIGECFNVVDVVDSDTAAIARQRRRAFPRPWSVTINATIYLR